MRLVHLSDLHLGYRQFQRQTPSGINQREADIAAVFRRVVDHVIEIRPDLVCIAGDVFHSVRPSNPSILLAFGEFARLTHALPDATVVMIAGNHDTPRSSETGCILRLFSRLGIDVVDTKPQRLAFPEKDLAVLAVPYGSARSIAIDPDPAFRYNVLVIHEPLEGTVPRRDEDVLGSDGAGSLLTPEEINAARWSYVALGNIHVYRQLAPNMMYTGAMEYTSFDTWGERREEMAAKLPGKLFIEFDLDSGRRTFHPIAPARETIELPLLSGRGKTAAELDADIRKNVTRCPGGIDDKIVRQLVRDVPRHIAREIDQKAIREFKRRALHFQLDTRRPEVVRISASGAVGRRLSLAEIVRDKLRDRTLPPGIDREALVDLGLRYLRDAEAAESASLPLAVESE